MVEAPGRPAGASPLLLLPPLPVALFGAEVPANRRRPSWRVMLNAFAVGVPLRASQPSMTTTSPT